MVYGVIVLLQGKAPSRHILVGAQHRHIATVKPLMNGTQSNYCVPDRRFVVKYLKNPSIPKPGDKEP